ncbi:unnamed protein product [Allacma fusca]|uniref:CHK kinase-like domain-containing protein n=1 Tax=Allacma fusca TaxID=39272 RepID=A0A8J2PZU2_9HEXA|nr:unnamed protein product [Allacma fusca]
MTDVSGNNSREKTTQWLEDVLQTYYTYLEKEKRPPEQTGAVDVVKISVIDFDIGPGFSGDGRLSTLSDLLSLKVFYKINDGEEEKTENLIVKIPPNDKSDREMAQMAQVDKREIHFYTEAAIDLQKWIKSRNADIKLSIPKCYFAKYHAQPLQDDGDNLSDAESVLVLQDLRPLGFTMRDFNSGLTLDEAKAALKQIAIVHGTSWAFQESTGEPLDDKWDFAYRPRKAASAYKMMIEQGFPTLAEFLDRQKPEGPELLTKLKALHPRAADLLCELLVPPAPPAPSCLTHMDFWCNNLLFRKRTPPDGSETESNKNGSSELESDDDNGETECQILDWQMMAISRPTHDVALLLFTSLTPETRHLHMDSLLQYYWNVFQETAQKLGVEIPFDFHCIKEEYKKSQLLALLLVVGSIDLALDGSSTEARLMDALRDMARDELI